MEAVEDQATEASAMVALGAFQLVQVEAMAAQATAPEDGHHPAMEVAAEDLEDQAMEAPVVAPATAVLLALEAAQGDGPALEYPAMEAVAAAVIEAVEDVEGMDAAAAEVVVTAGLHSRCRVTEEGPVEAPAGVTGPRSVCNQRFGYLVVMPRAARRGARLPFAAPAARRTLLVVGWVTADPSVGPTSPSRAVGPSNLTTVIRTVCLPLAWRSDRPTGSHWVCRESSLLRIGRGWF